MDIHHLRIFAAVYRNRSFSKASEQLHISQPTISEHIKNLEEELGARLFDRLGRSILPTREAEAIYPRALHITEEMDRLKDSVHSAQSRVKGEITIGSSTIPGSYILPRLAMSFRAMHPEVSFRMLIGDSRKVTDMVVGHEVNMAVVGSAVEPEKLIYTPFRDDEIILAAPANHPGPMSIPLRELAVLPFLMREEGSGTRKTVESLLKEKGISARDLSVVAVLGSTDAIKQALLAGAGVSFISRVAVADELKRGVLKEIGVKGLKLTRTFYLATHKKRVLPGAYKAFFDYLLEGR